MDTKLDESNLQFTYRFLLYHFIQRIASEIVRFSVCCAVLFVHWKEKCVKISVILVCQLDCRSIDVDGKQFCNISPLGQISGHGCVIQLCRKSITFLNCTDRRETLILLSSNYLPLEGHKRRTFEHYVKYPESSILSLLSHRFPVKYKKTMHLLDS